MLIAPPAEPDPLSRAWFDAALEAGHPMTDDGYGPVTAGVSWTEMNVVDGCRQSAADAYLRPNRRKRPNLAVVTIAASSPSWCLMGSGAAAPTTPSAIYRSSCRSRTRGRGVCRGSRHSASADDLGIGPAAHLRDVGIDVLVDVPGVGQNLLDQPMCWITFGAAAPLPSTTRYPHVLFIVAALPSIPIFRSDSLRWCSALGGPSGRNQASHLRSR